MSKIFIFELLVNKSSSFTATENSINEWFETIKNVVTFSIHTFASHSSSKKMLNEMKNGTTENMKNDLKNEEEKH